MTLKSILENTPVAASAHMFGGHCKKGNPNFPNGKAYFTDSMGAELDVNGALAAVVSYQSKALTLTQSFLHAEKSIDGVDSKAGQKLRLIASSDKNTIAIAFTDGTQTGLDSYQGRLSICTWMVFVVSKTLVSSRHSWVTAFPSTDAFVNRRFS